MAACLFCTLGLLQSPALAVDAGAPVARDDAKTVSAKDSSVRIYLAREVITMNPDQPAAEAVAVSGETILGVGSKEEMLALAGDDRRALDHRYADNVMLPGFIEQHIHPILSAITLSSEIISIEEWDLPDGSVYPAVRDRNSYLKRLAQVEAGMAKADELLLSWGFHHYFHGRLTRRDLDAISATRPIIIWHRSAHEFVLNSAALHKVDLNPATSPNTLPGASELARSQIDLEAGHFWEAGAFDFLLPKLLPLIIGDLKKGLELTEQYLHRAGVTTAAEPGGLSAFYAAQIAVLGDADTPLRFYFIPDGRALAVTHDGQALLSATQNLAPANPGSTTFLPKQVKLFADGAIFSQLMQMRDGYLDGHHGEWMMEEGVFNRAFSTYWDAGYQIHVHQNGDLGLDRVITALRENMQRKPREDHRTTIVHFGFATPEQVEQLAALGAIVSANPYYVTALADKYSEIGIGPKRAREMVRLADVVEQGMSLSLHSDMPMAPAKPLYLMWAAVNRTTFSGQVAASGLALSVEQALQAVTLSAAYSLRLENDIGSIEPGKRADFTVLEQSPFRVPRAEIKNIAVIATVSDGHDFPVPQQ
ncbi:MAG: amidohydrolase [Halioglobus sp.]